MTFELGKKNWLCSKSRGLALWLGIVKVVDKKVRLRSLFIAFIAVFFGKISVFVILHCTDIHIIGASVASTPLEADGNFSIYLYIYIYVRLQIKNQMIFRHWKNVF